MSLLCNFGLTIADFRLPKHGAGYNKSSIRIRQSEIGYRVLGKNYRLPILDPDSHGNILLHTTIEPTTWDMHLLFISEISKAVVVENDEVFDHLFIE